MKTKDLLEILATPSPSGWEKDGKRLWMNHVASVAETVMQLGHQNILGLDGSERVTILPQLIAT